MIGGLGERELLFGKEEGELAGTTRCEPAA
jgi:hypothetical protein